jgi:hypothetical protein
MALVMAADDCAPDALHEQNATCTSRNVEERCSAIQLISECREVVAVVVF